MQRLFFPFWVQSTNILFCFLWQSFVYCVTFWYWLADLKYTINVTFSVMLQDLQIFCKKQKLNWFYEERCQWHYWIHDKIATKFYFLGNLLFTIEWWLKFKMTFNLVSYITNSEWLPLNDLFEKLCMPISTKYCIKIVENF